jgi:hypothetical protein
MASSRHLRTDSSESTSSNGSSYQLILDHILTYPSTYEIPLRTMYQLNCAPRGQSLGGTPTSSTASSPITPNGTFPEDRATQSFTESLMAQIQQLPNQPKVLPPSFITHFLQRCFPARLEEVDFPQALTGLDYLKDLEARRRREVRAAMDRLGIEPNALDTDQASYAASHPTTAAWVKSIEEKERKIDALYTQLYIGLRRWILVNELSLAPFNKHNCVAMLNTLYPPVISSQPTSKLTREVLKNQRDGFFKYIQSVEKNGPLVLRTLMQQGKAPTDKNGWLQVTRTLGLFLQLANSVISECSDLSDVSQLLPRRSGEVKVSRQAKADSGVSFNSTEAPPSNRSSTAAEPVSPVEPARPKTPSGGKHSSTLEKLARGLKTIGRNRTDATEMISEPMTSTGPFGAAEKPKTLRKMRSMGAIEGRKRSDAAPLPQESFDPNEMRRHRLRYEAGVMASQKFGRNQSHEI